MLFHLRVVKHCYCMWFGKFVQKITTKTTPAPLLLNQNDETPAYSTKTALKLGNSTQGQTIKIFTSQGHILMFSWCFKEAEIVGIITNLAVRVKGKQNIFVFNLS